MLLRRNLLETLTLICCAGTVSCYFLNYVTNISPITGVWFHLYILLLFILSITGSIKLLKWLLRHTRPIKYDLEGLVVKYPVFRGFVDVFPKPNQSRTSREKGDYKEYDTNELSVISSVLERKLVSSWYVPYISQEIGFPFACKQILDQIIGKAFQICHKIENKDVYIDVCSILISHLKEYKKAMNRQEKSPKSSIEDLYKKSHAIFDDRNKHMASDDHCTCVLRLILKELTPWELWDTPHSELLVRILSKKLDAFIDNTLAHPRWLNDKLLKMLSEKTKNTDSDRPDSEPVVTTNEPSLVVSSNNQTVQKDEMESKLPSNAELLNASINITVNLNDENQLELSEQENTVVFPKCIPKDVTTNGNGIQIEDTEEDIATEMFENKSPVLRQRRGRQGKNEVKIYDRVIEGSVKTWETDMDLQCISMGQDLLASLDGEITLSRLWGQDAELEGSPNPPRRKSPQPLWFGEEDAIDMELSDQTETSPHKSPKKEISPKPAELLKELQTTVHQAKTKIGDLQDEAAGMMEGLLDFGIAGLKKGLRFTGLGDDTQEKDRFFPSHKERSSLEKHSPISDVPLNRAFHDAIDQEEKNEKENGVTVPLHREENGTSIPQLTKQQRVSSQDSVGLQSRGRSDASLPVLIPSSDSPEPQYEEAADLSTSIAKLRSLLQQCDQDTGSSEEVWWQSAEETRGRTQRHRSSRPVDAAALADEYDMNAVERNPSPGPTSNNIQRLDKLFHRTVTGVFNSIRTAVGAEEAAAGAGAGAGAAAGAGAGAAAGAGAPEWTYVCTGVEQSVSGAVGRLVGGRRSAAHVEAALDSLEHLAAPPPAQPPLDDDEEWWSSGPRGLCLAEAACAARLLRSHVARRLAALLLQDLAEPLVTAWLDGLACWLRDQIFTTFRHMSDEPADDAEHPLRELDVEETCALLLERVPAPFKLFGEDTLTETVRLTVSSFSHKEINRDVAFRLLDIFVVQFKMAAAVRNPSFEN